MESFRHMLRSARKVASRLLNLDALASYNTIIYKAANIIAAEKIDGDYLEFGVFRGDSFIQAYHTLKGVFSRHQRLNAGRNATDALEIKRIWDNLRLFAFDSFQGLPELEGLDTESRDFGKGKYACAEDAFLRQLASKQVDLAKVVTVPGWFQETCIPATIAKHNMRQASIIHIDCDLYASTKAALAFVTTLLADGTVLIFDDWYCFRGNPSMGEQRAFREWSQALQGWVFTEYQKEGPWANSFIASRCNSASPGTG